MSHCLQEQTFTRFTYCENCGGLLWGFARQGLQCRDCAYICHHGCQNDIPPCTHGAAPSSTYSPAAKALRSLQQTQQPTAARRRPESMPNIDASQLRRLFSSDHVQNVLVDAAVHASDTDQPVNDYLAHMPPLNPQITAKNFSRFVARCGPLFAFRDAVILLLSWDKPIDTLVALISYCILCLYPALILFIPSLVLLWIIIGGYYKRYGDTLHPSTSESSMQEGPTTVPSKSFTPAPNTPLKRTAFAFSFASALFPAFDESSPEYLRNMQNLQNMMGEMSDVYDLVMVNMQYVNWSDEEQTMRLLQLVLVSLVGLSLVGWLIPLNWICLVAGVAVFLINTRFAKYAMKELLPPLIEFGQCQMNNTLAQYNEYEKRVTSEQQIQQVSLYENQRWWSNSGFAPQLLRDERGPWSDMSGRLALSCKEEFAAPEGYQWKEDNWELDTTGPWIDDSLGIGKNNETKGI
ncbi:integral peroxisomal membrane peroxin-domain-containing protein [Radiomyces spectabilis]|uniref:integral peroxisomal membrane peroxin-domain-containing protein n=1 Tax=Radiomyces spectabilis TaxID=64574 RepID=UPI00221FB123|nr:integral peroxisomal membrane peroxin-domain-containing protein [Radiomyces spectabilis]KAI8391591.1 integral peroxisomal membrane peroxin-domain-containing protein [Radiomyces spectabilis]